MNDTILLSLVNLFALFANESKGDKDMPREILSAYLTHHFGVRDFQSYLDSFDTLSDFYADNESVDSQAIVKEICSKLVDRISAEEQTMMLLRLMEFCAVNGMADWNDSNFLAVASMFDIPHSQYNEFLTFLKDDEESETVKTLRIDGVEGFVKTIYIKAFDLLAFSSHCKEQLLMNDIPLMPNAFQIWQRSGVLKAKTAHPLYYYMAMAQYNGNEGKGGKRYEIVVKGENVNYIYPGSNNGIHNLQFSLYSGELVAVMGGSGTGKSTLISLLNGTLEPQSGTITFNGHDINDPEVKELIGFVPQDDLLIEELTVYENLWFTAKLCFDGMPDEELDRKVHSVLNDLGLEPAANLKVGSPINKYISGGQRKRLNIALELIREPSILFLDEPTSGLSSADAEMLVNLLKEQAFKGKIVLSIIHQPSSDVFKMFDKLWILDKGGYPVYDGNPIEAVTYFKQMANYADSTMSMCPVCGNVNPEIIFSIIDEKALSETGKQLDKRKISPEEWHSHYLQHKQKTASPKGTEDKSKDTAKCSSLPKTNQKTPGWVKQTGIYLHRNLKMKATNWQYIIITCTEAPILALICALLTRYAPPEGYSIMDNINLVSYYFMAIIVAILLGMSGSAEEIIKDRALLKREKFLSLSHTSYIWSKIIFMGIVSLIQTILFILVGNSIMGIQGMFGTWCLILFVSSFLAGLTGLWLSQTLNSVVSIYISIPLLLIPQILLCGMVVTFAELTPKSTTGNVPLLGDLVPSRWAFEALAVSSFAENDYEKHFFEEDKERYEATYYSQVYLYEMKSQLETLHDKQTKGETTKLDHMEVIKNSLPRLAYICNMEPYSGDYSYPSLTEYFRQATKILEQKRNQTTLKMDKKVSQMVKEMGMEQIKRLKRNNYNMRLEALVMNSTDKHQCKVVSGYIVPNSGIIFLQPQSPIGKAPFYSSEKILGNYHIKTLWYNIGVLIIMCIIASLCLFLDFPGKLVREKRN